jgi:glyoxylase-like metal-dependent hydrolase (beta-lactamase superfamily II)
MINSRMLSKDVELYQIIEFHGPTHDAQWMLPGLSAEALQENLRWLSPDYFMPLTNRLVFTFQLWLLKMPDGFVIVDTGVGNFKSRIAPSQNMLNNPVLDWLKAIGADPENVKHVVCTHLHGDHVGWNTQWVGGQWVPTFPHATYYLPRVDWDTYSERSKAGTLPQVFEQPFIDSVVPIMAAGKVRFVDDGDQVAGLTAIAAPGHTPGTMVYSLQTGGQEYLFTGDVIHSPIQILYPHINSRWCELQDIARNSRMTLLQRVAERGANILPAHAKLMRGWHVKQQGNQFMIDIQA